MGLVLSVRWQGAAFAIMCYVVDVQMHTCIAATCVCDVKRCAWRTRREALALACGSRQIADMKKPTCLATCGLGWVVVG